MKHGRVAQQMTAIGGSAIMLAAILGTTPAAAVTTDSPTPVASQPAVAAQEATDRVVNVSRPFRVSAATRDGRLTVVSESDSSVRVYSAAPRKVTFQLVRTADKSQRQNHKFTVRLKKGVNFVRNLEAGRTYRINHGAKSHLQITPMKKVADVTAVQAAFTTKRTEARLSVEHVADWTRGGTSNTMYRWKITSYGKNMLRNGIMSAGGTTQDPTMMIDLPSEGMFRIDIAAMNPLGSTSMTLFSQETVETAWQQRGPQGEIRLAALPPIGDVEIGPAPAADEPEEEFFGGGAAVDPNAVALTNATVSAANAAASASAASSAAEAARTAASPEAASRAAAEARKVAVEAAEYASLAKDYRDLIPESNEFFAAAEQAVIDAEVAAAQAALSADEATAFAADHWRNEAKRAMAEAAQHAEAAAARSSLTADEEATQAATRARYAATQAAFEASLVSATNPELAAQAQEAAVEADHAADQAEAAAAMARVAEQYRQAELIATTPADAAAASAAATRAAQEARAASDQEQAEPYDSAAASYADRADTYAEAAAQAASDVANRVEAQQQAIQAEDNLQQSARSLVRTRTSADSSSAFAQAQASYNYAGAAETNASTADSKRALIADTSDERPAADVAAAEASVAGELARANSDDAMRHVTTLTANESKAQHDLADAADEYSTADEYAGNARTLAERAWAAVDLIDDANAEDLAAATERANITQAYADLAGIYAEETRQRELAQGAASQASNQLQQAARTATAEEAYAFLVEARNQATAAEAARDAIAASIADREATFGPDARANDQLARAEAAAQQARADALTAEQYALPTQAMLDEELAIDAASLTVTPGGDTQLTFAKNPNDTRAVLRYSAHANGIPGTLTDNGDGTITMTWQGLPIAASGYTFTVVPAGINDERVSTNHTTYQPTAISPAELSGLLTMREASITEVCGETPRAPGSMENGECVGTKPLKYDTAALVYETRAYTYTTTTVMVWSTCSSGYTDESGQFHWIEQPHACQVPQQQTVKNAHPAGFTDNGSQYVAINPNPTPGRNPRIDAAFTDTSWSISGGRYVAVSPLPAADFNDTVTYTYESGKNAYVTRNAPAIAKTFAPTFASLPNGVIAWTATPTTGSPATYTELDGDDTGRFTPTITVHTIGGNVQVPAPTVNGVAADQ